MVDAVKTLPGDILGHLHVPGKFGHWPSESSLEQHEDRILDACAERGMGIEINTRVFYRSSDPAVHAHHLGIYRRLLRKCVERDLPIAIGSDAHSPKDQGGGIDKILPLLDEMDINEIVFPINGTLARVALRGDRPIKSRPSVVIQPARQAIATEQDAESAGEMPSGNEPAHSEPIATIVSASVPPPQPVAAIAPPAEPEPQPIPLAEAIAAVIAPMEQAAELKPKTAPVKKAKPSEKTAAPKAGEAKPESKATPAAKSRTRQNGSRKSDARKGYRQEASSEETGCKSGSRKSRSQGTRQKTGSKNSCVKTGRFEGAGQDQHGQITRKESRA